MMYRDHDGVGALAGVLFLLLFGGALAALVVGLMMLFRRGGRPAFASPGPAGHPAQAGYPGATPAAGWGPEPGYPSPHATLAAEQTLADRLARGDIDVADYEQRLAALRRSRPLPPGAPGTPGGPASASFGVPPVAPPAPGTPPAPGAPPAAD